MNEDGINYSFTGDVSSLEKATSTAIDLLTSIEAKYEDVAKAGQIVGSKTSLGQFLSSLRNANKQLASLQKTAKDVGDVQFNPDSKSSENISSLLDALTQVNTYMKELQATSGKIDSTDLGIMSSYIRDANNQMAGLNTQVLATTGNIGGLVKSLATDGISNAFQNVKDALDIRPEIVDNLDKLGFEGVADAVDSTTEDIQELEAEWLQAQQLLDDENWAMASDGLSDANREAEEMSMWMDVWDQKLAQFDGNVKKAAASMDEIANAAEANGDYDLRPYLQDEIDNPVQAPPIDAWETFNAILSTTESIVMGIGAAFSALGSVAVTAVDVAMGPFNELISKVESHIKKWTTTIARIFRGKVIRAFFKDMSAAFDALAQHSTKAAAAISSMKTSAAYLQGSLVASLAPVLETIAALVESLTNKIVALINAMNMLFAKLAGAATFTKAIKVTQKFGAAASGAAGAAKELKNQLLSIDELNVLKNDSSSGGGSGGDTPTFEFVDEDILDTWYTDLAGNIRDAIEAQNFAAIGQILGNAINEGVAKFDQYISWNNVSVKVTEFMQKFGSAFNWGIATINWNLVGQTLGDAFETIFNTVGAFIDAIDWTSLGTALANSLNGFTSSEATDAFGKSLGKIITAGIEASFGFVANVDWSQLGTAIGDAITEFFENTDFEKLGITLTDLASGILEALKKALDETDWQMVGEKIAECLNQIDWAQLVDDLGAAAGALVMALLKAIWGFIKSFNWGKFLAEILTNSVAPGFGKIMGTLGKLSGMDKIGEEIGKALIDGIGLGVNDNNPWSKLYESLKTNFQGFFDYMKEWWEIGSPSKKTANIGEDIANGIPMGIDNKWPNILEHARTKMDELNQTFKTKYGEVKQAAEDKWESIKEAVKAKIALMKDESSEKAENLKTGLNSIWNSIKDEATTVFGNLVQPIVDKFTSLNDAIKSPLRSIITTIQSWLNSVIMGVNTFIGAINSIGKSSLASKFGLSFYVNPISSVTLPGLASGGVVTSATQAVIGEGRYDEAVIPLGDSPQMTELVQKIADAVESRGDQRVQVIIGDREWDTFVVKSYEKGIKKVGARPVRVGGN